MHVASAFEVMLIERERVHVASRERMDRVTVFDSAVDGRNYSAICTIAFA
jgi:hypothetical protein